MLDLKFNICVSNACTNLQFTEETGIYNSTSNTTGYGTPNIDISDVDTAVLNIKGPDGIIYNVDLYATMLFPSDNTTLSYIIPLSLFGSPTNIVDGQWKFTYTITTTDEETYTKTKYFYFYCNSECCVAQMLSNLDLDGCGCDCKSIEYDDYIKAWTFLQSLKNAAKCGNVNTFTKIKKIIDKLCKNKGCKTCK